MLESIHRSIALKSSLSNGILESMCVMDCTPFIKVLLLPFFRFSFLQVTLIVLLYCLLDSLEEIEEAIAQSLEAIKL